MDDKQLNISRVYLDNSDYEELCIFNGFQFPLLPGISYFMDGQQGKRVLFLTDEKETFIISFEQGMKCLDIDLSHTKGYTPVHCEYRQGSRYLHQLKLLCIDTDIYQNLIYFRMEYTEKDGTVHTCPGQMSISSVYIGQDGVEPVLLQLLKGFALYSSKGGA